jgi:hypothetical protein
VHIFIDFGQLCSSKPPCCGVPWSGDGEHIAEGGDSLDMDRPSTRRGHVLLAPGGWSEKVAHLVMGPAEAGSAEVVLEAPHRPVAPFYSSMILFQMVILAANHLS